MEKRIAIFASGSGTNAENIIRYFQGHTAVTNVTVALVLSNAASAGVLKRAAKLDTPTFVFSKTTLAQSDMVLNKLLEFDIDFIVLAGFLLKIPDNILRAYPDEIINIHPALLPKYGGKRMYGMRVHEAVAAAGEKETGITIHYVNEQYDEGKVVFQAKVNVLKKDTPEQIAEKVHQLEYKHYPKVIESLLVMDD